MKYQIFFHFQKPAIIRIFKVLYLTDILVFAEPKIEIKTMNMLLSLLLEYYEYTKNS